MRFDAFGVTLRITGVEEDDLESVPGRESASGSPATELSVVRDERAGFVVLRDEEVVLRLATREQASRYAVGEIEHAIAELAPDLVFLHSGVVAIGGKALLVVGDSHSGKSTLVRALLEAGATYYSDEYAVIDAEGLVHPYARPLSIRDGDVSVRVHADELGAEVGSEPVEVGGVLLVRYDPDEATHAVERLGSGQALLALMQHTAITRRSPELVLDALGRMVEGAVVLSGRRGDAEALAAFLIDTPPWAG